VNALAYRIRDQLIILSNL